MGGRYGDKISNRDMKLESANLGRSLMEMTAFIFTVTMSTKK